ncbi:MAG: HAD-IIA family hydrolase [Chloroflexi bacterium]|nr:HAD-IIA family hydrolase [Chloroflexota bacterium]
MTPPPEAPRYAGYILDLDGTVYLGDELVPGARDTLAWLRAHGRAVVFLSNKPLEPSAHYAAKLTRLGIPARAADVLNSTQALIQVLRSEYPGERLFVIGEPSLWDELSGEGFCLTRNLDEIGIVVAAFDRTLDYAKLNLAHQALVRGAHFLATNADRTCPVDGGAIPDCGPVIAFLETSTGRSVELVAGKPSRAMLDAAVRRLGVPMQQCLMVGDRLSTDMTMGLNAGMPTALVLSGVTTREQLAASDLRPTWVLDSIAQLP